IQLYPEVHTRLAEIEKVVITTHESAIRIIDKTGPLYNPADRDHCIQYMTAVGLIFGELTAAYYEDAAASDPRIDALRDKMVLVENPQYSRDYLDPEKRSITNAVQVFYRDGSQSQNVVVEYPLGHRRRREEGIPLLIEKFKTNLARRFPPFRADQIMALCSDQNRLEATPVNEFVDLFAV
ncbi:MAG: 2-methylcitrate dehydratase, partial [Bellilinea sp.]